MIDFQFNKIKQVCGLFKEKKLWNQDIILFVDEKQWNCDFRDKNKMRKEEEI